MQAITKIVYAASACVIAWLALCALVIVMTGDAADIHTVAVSTFTIVDHVADAIRQLLPTSNAPVL
ncbi:hypothetical protein ACWEKT_39420 [Nocardia takedensis]